MIIFQSTHPWRVRPAQPKPHAPKKSNFNPRTREGCDDEDPRGIDKGIKFQSTHPWRVRRSFSTIVNGMVKFQSTHPWRVRPILEGISYTAETISIHAPVKGATSLRSLKFRGDWWFQSTHPWRVRHVYKQSQANLIVFQSTHPWRVRLICYSFFNISFTISIHAPVKGATSRNVSIRSASLISIHAPVKGATSKI